MERRNKETASTIGSPVRLSFFILHLLSLLLLCVRYANKMNDFSFCIVHMKAKKRQCLLLYFRNVSHELISTYSYSYSMASNKLFPLSSFALSRGWCLCVQMHWSSLFDATILREDGYNAIVPTLTRTCWNTLKFILCTQKTKNERRGQNKKKIRISVYIVFVIQ